MCDCFVGYHHTPFYLYTSLKRHGLYRMFIPACLDFVCIACSAFLILATGTDLWAVMCLDLACIWACSILLPMC